MKTARHRAVRQLLNQTAYQQLLAEPVEVLVPRWLIEKVVQLVRSLACAPLVDAVAVTVKPWLAVAIVGAAIV